MGFELERVSVRLVREQPYLSDTKIHTPQDAVCVLRDIMQDLDREIGCVINLKSDGTPINCSIISQGTIDYAIMHPREILKTAILSNAAGIIMMHNHLGGSVLPSQQDISITNRMVNVCELMKIPLYDHVITCADSNDVYSFCDRQIMPDPRNIDYSKINSDIAYSAKVLTEKLKTEYDRGR
ncbi:MAG: JAB domain-containing protein [Wujia sp.]